MSSVRVLLVVATPQVALGFVQDFLPTLCVDYSEHQCIQGTGCYWWVPNDGNTPAQCNRERVEYALQPLDGICNTFQLKDGPYACMHELAGSSPKKVEQYDGCERECAADPKCLSFTVDDGNTVDYNCRLCSNRDFSTFVHDGFRNTFSGTKVCTDCADVKSQYCEDYLGCTFNESSSVCERQCSIPDANPDGTCNNFCIKERMQCKSEDNFHAYQEESAEACQEKVPLGTDAFDFATTSGRCSLCQTAELVDEDRQRHAPFYAGVRTCNPATTTILATTLATTESTTASTMAPSESMTGDVTASQEIAKLMLSRHIRAEVTDAAEEKQVIHYEIPFIGGLVGGITVTLLVFVAKRRYASVGSSEVEE